MNGTILGGAAWFLSRVALYSAMPVTQLLTLAGYAGAVAWHGRDTGLTLLDWGLCLIVPFWAWWKFVQNLVL